MNDFYNCGNLEVFIAYFQLWLNYIFCSFEIVVYMLLYVVYIFCSIYVTMLQVEKLIFKRNV